MNVSTVILYIMMFFMLVGIADKLIFGGKFGYGEQFDKGIMAMGSLAMSMIGMMCFAPILGALLVPLVTPLYNLIGSDPAMIAGSVLAIDMGGYSLAKIMTDNAQIQNLSGIYVGSMMGATIVFSIPVALGIVEERDKPYLAKGILAGFVSVPFGAFVSGVVSGTPPVFVLLNLVPLVILALLFAVGLAIVPNAVLKGFNVFAKLITILITICFGAAILEGLVGIVVIPGMDPIAPQLGIVGHIAVRLAGAYPMIHFITTALLKPLTALGRMLGVNKAAVGGMVACLANNVPTFGMLKDMDGKGKVLAVAFSVCASFTMSGQLSFASTQSAEVVFPMIAGKLSGGVIGIVIANVLITGKKASKAPAA